MATIKKTAASSVVTLPPEFQNEEVKALVQQFATTCEPLEASRGLFIFIDARTGAHYCECHIKARKLIEPGTIDVPLDPEEQSDYRANRDLMTNHVAFDRMKQDALDRRTFSHIVAEFTSSFDADHPLKIIGGQHRFEAIRLALDKGIDEHHGIKVYFALDSSQRLDVQLISNTSIAVSGDLIDPMQETTSGPDLRDWCLEVGFLAPGQDFADRRQRGRQITVQAARTFIINYYKGRSVDARSFDGTDTTPVVCESGVTDENWTTLKKEQPALWADKSLKAAGKEFSLLVAAQRAAFVSTAGPKKSDLGEKALNFAIVSAWAYVAGILHNNRERIKRHYELRLATGKDPLNAAALAKGRHKTDPENYRGLGYRTDSKERGRFVELFFAHAEKGSGISPAIVDVAIKKYHAKQAVLEALRAEQKVRGV